MKMQNAYLASEARGGPGGCGEERGQRWARYESQWPDLDFGSPGVRGGGERTEFPVFYRTLSPSGPLPKRGGGRRGEEERGCGR